MNPCCRVCIRALTTSDFLTSTNLTVKSKSDLRTSHGQRRKCRHSRQWPCNSLSTTSAAFVNGKNTAFANTMYVASFSIYIPSALALVSQWQIFLLLKRSSSAEGEKHLCLTNRASVSPSCQSIFLCSLSLTVITDTVVTFSQSREIRNNNTRKQKWISKRNRTVQSEYLTRFFFCQPTFIKKKH